MLPLHAAASLYLQLLEDSTLNPHSRGRLLLLHAVLQQLLTAAQVLLVRRRCQSRIQMRHLVKNLVHATGRTVAADTCAIGTIVRCAIGTIARSSPLRHRAFDDRDDRPSGQVLAFCLTNPLTFPPMNLQSSTNKSLAAVGALRHSQHRLQIERTHVADWRSTVVAGAWTWP